ncbi:MAG TPA: thrombospondin type 3 repeat-containing protein [Verrucomicrobiae bacterium]|nr:thrombospondin type 3 repeat-containing protein [Verrucomicrobiae bacterium]
MANAQLGPLQNNDGQTDTMALAINSPALDKGKSFGLTLDQRGHLRLADSPSIPNASGGDGVDIGAFELHHPCGPDNDSDGMTDDFETFYGFNSNNPSDGARDNDGDGLTNAQEFTAGTNPLDPRSNLRITAIAKNGSNLDITLGLAVVGKSYRLERKLNLTDANWQSIAGVSILVPITSGPAQFPDPNAISLGKAFYRPCILGTPGCGWKAGDLVTYSQTTWSDDPTATDILFNNFDAVYFGAGGDLEVGIPGSGGFSMVFLMASDVANYLPAVGPPGPLAADHLNSTTTSSGSFGGNVVALALNVDFSDAGVLVGASGLAFGDLRLCNQSSGPNDLTVREVLAIANTLLGGGAAPYTIAQVDALLQQLNVTFGGGQLTTFAQENLFMGSCPCTASRWKAGDMETYGQGAWGDSSTTVGMRLGTHFDTIYPDPGHLVVGGDFVMRFQTAAAVWNYLPAAGPNNVLNSNHMDPDESSAGAFGGQVVALRINVDFSEADLLLSTTALGDLYICNYALVPAVNGMTVEQFLALANNILGGNNNAVIDADQASTVANAINTAFVNGVPSAFAQECLFVGGCP